MAKISQIYAREIINSKADPTVEVTVLLDNGLFATSSCPTGTSLSSHEAKEIRDNDPARFLGRGNLTAVSNILNIISPKLKGLDVERQRDIDKILLELDSTPDKSKLGVNSILPVSTAIAKTAAKSMNMPLFVYIKQYSSNQNAPYKIPTPVFNIINGGLHAGGNLDFQEFLIIPATSIEYPNTLNMAVSVYQSLKKTLKEKGTPTLVGDEGGFGPNLSSNRDALSLLGEAISNSNYKLNYDIFLGLDASANSFYKDGNYRIKDKDASLSAEDLVTIYQGINDEFNLLYLEDPLSEDDWSGWENLNKMTAKNTIIVGDDLTATNPQRLQTAISKHSIGGIIIKPNQIGTLTEALAVVEMARAAGLKIIASHRSGETNDDFIADFSVGIGADYVKFGAPVRGERVAKYNRLSEIYLQIKSS